MCTYAQYIPRIRSYKQHSGGVGNSASTIASAVRESS